ncbi:MAG: CRISPR-associated endoribonuclease Cas6 [Balneolaceae bacterium]|nr:CRISPR-associated endoribonuclease Cas6 [Balneolaceae bacterium]
MKIRIRFSENAEPVPFQYPYQLCGLFHHWLGNNDLHGKISLYSLGWLKGKTDVKNGALHFPRGAVWDIGIYNSGISEQMIRGLLLKDFVFHGMQIKKVDRLKPPAFHEGSHRFLAGSPVLLRKVEQDGSRTHVIYDDPASSTILNRLIHKKASEADFGPGEELSLRFDSTYRNPKTKLVDIKGIKNRASVCPVIAEGPPEALEFLWTVGAGELTGVGFGSLDHTATMR